MSLSDPDDRPSNPCASHSRHLGDLIEARLSRRKLIGGVLSVAGMLAAAPALSTARLSTTRENGRFTFREIARGSDEHHHVPEGYTADILLKWGDHLFDSNASDFDPHRQSEREQLRRFGFNNDYIGFLPLDENRGLLCVNHEYPSSHLMFPGISRGFPKGINEEQVFVEMAALGGSIVEVKREGSQWKPVIGSRFNRRITPHRTPMEITGPAAGHPRLCTSEDPTGKLASGTMNNCAGGMTPWGTWLMAEENFNLHFSGTLPVDHPEAASHERYGLSHTVFAWGLFVDRYNVEKEPREPNRFGWIVEVDPKDPKSIPKKRTALGRFKHEGAETVIAPDGRIVIYMGDDQRFDYVYKFVSKQVYVSDNPSADLLDEGILYVARFGEDGYVDWLPLVLGQGPLTSVNGFNSQADVLIETRRAADLLGATPMDRPEDVQPHQETGRAWVMLTNNNLRNGTQIDAANPRANNTTGHIIEIVEPGGDFAATRSRWEILVQCGDPSKPAARATWNSATSPDGWFGSPDNGAIDPMGRLWVATDGNQYTGAADGLWAMETDGDQRGTGKAFFRAPLGAEVCGPQFTPDGKTLFLSVQHPGDGRNSTFEKPACRWPDFNERVPPRPGVIAIRQLNGKKIGS